MERVGSGGREGRGQSRRVNGDFGLAGSSSVESLIRNMSLPIACKVYGRAARQREHRDPVHLIPIRDPAVFLAP